METLDDQAIVIAGGGIGGCSAALALARKGFAAVVLEQASELKELGAGIQLGPNAFRVFDELGVREAIEEVVAYPDNLVMMDAISGEQVTRIPLGQPFLDRFGQPYAVIYRADLHRVLVEACRAHANVRLLTDQKVIGFRDDGGRVSALTESGGEFTGRALVGADGMWSKIRDRVVGDGKPRKSGHIAYRAVLPTSQVPEHLRFNDMTLWAGPKLHLVQYPLRRGELFNLVAVFHSDRYEEGWNSYGDIEELQLRFKAACEPVQTLLSKIETWRMWVLCDREPVSDWSVGRVTLLGDAAHPMLQYLAQGAAMAMEDAVVLARRLEQAADDIPGALLAYQKDRYLRTCRVQLTARLYGDVYHAAGPVRELRNAYLQSRTREQGQESLAWLYDPI